MFKILAGPDEDLPPTRPLGVLIITCHTDPASLLRLKRQITELLAKHYQVSVIAPACRNDQLALPEEVFAYYYPLVKGSGLLQQAFDSLWHYVCQFALACWVLLGEGFDAIQTVNPPDGICLIGGFFKFLFNTKVMFDCRVLMPELYESRHKSRGLRYGILRLIEKMAFATADVVLVPNQSYRSVAMTRGKKSTDQVFIVGDSPDLEKSALSLPEFGLPKGKKHLVCCSSLADRPDGIPCLVEAVRHIVHDIRRTDIHFALTGDHNIMKPLQDSIAQKQVNDYVSITTPAVLSAADICVCPSEVNPLNDKTTAPQIIDYMALGKPIVQFECTEGRFTAGNASLYAAANDAKDFARKIIELIDDPQKRAAMGALGRTRIERVLAWSYEAPRFRAACDALLPAGAESPVHFLL